MDSTILAGRFRGCLLGLAVGDALGTTLEKMKEVPIPITDMEGGGPFNLLPGEFTDDTSTALLLGESLISCNGFSGKDQLNCYYKWFTTGHLGANNECFDIGIGTRMAVLAYKASGIPFPNAAPETRAGNGSLMRLAPVVLAYHNQEPDILFKLVALSSQTTHTAVACIHACQFYASLIIGALFGNTKEELLDPNYFDDFRNNNDLERDTLCPEVMEILKGSYLHKQPPEIIGGGYVIHALEAALWAFASTDTFEAGALKVANLGDDADTTTAIFGQLAGAFYGEDGIPSRWREKLAFEPFIVAMANELARKSTSMEISLEIDDEAIKPADDADSELPTYFGPISESYRLIHTCMIILEREYQAVKRRMEPGPKQFQNLVDLDNAVQAFAAAYRSAAPECIYKEPLLQKEWLDRIIKTQRAKLALKLAKPKITLPFGLKKN